MEEGLQRVAVARGGGSAPGRRALGVREGLGFGLERLCGLGGVGRALGGWPLERWGEGRRRWNRGRQAAVIRGRDRCGYTRAAKQNAWREKIHFFEVL